MYELDLGKYSSSKYKGRRVIINRDEGKYLFNKYRIILVEVKESLINLIVIDENTH